MAQPAPQVFGGCYSLYIVYIIDFPLARFRVPAQIIFTFVDLDDQVNNFNIWIMARFHSTAALMHPGHVMVQNTLGFKRLLTDAASVCEHIPKVHAFNVIEQMRGPWPACTIQLSTQRALILILSHVDHKLLQVIPIFYLTV